MKHDRQYDIQALERQVKDSDGAKGTRDVLPLCPKNDSIPAYPGDVSERSELSRNRRDHHLQQAVIPDQTVDGMSTTISGAVVPKEGKYYKLGRHLSFQQM